jgi:ketosteroid isomerase-like protein
MSAEENRHSTEEAYAAFAKGDAEGAMRNLDDNIQWIARGDNALTGTYKGKAAVAELWGKLMSKEFRTQPHDFVADGDKVVALCTVTLEGETDESADILTFNSAGRVIAFDTLGDEAVPNRVFAS